LLAVLHTRLFVQSDVAVHCTQVFVVVSHAGRFSVWQSVEARHPTHVFVVVSHTGFWNPLQSLLV
jgi:hypothetical protein